MAQSSRTNPTSNDLAKNEQLLPVLLDRLAIDEPEAIWGEYPVSPTTYDAGFKTVTYKQLSNAVNGVAWWLERTLGKGQNHETLAYIGLNDLRYPILILGAIKAGYKVCHASAKAWMLC